MMLKGVYCAGCKDESFTIQNLHVLSLLTARFHQRSSYLRDSPSTLPHVHMWHHQ